MKGPAPPKSRIRAGGLQGCRGTPLPHDHHHQHAQTALAGGDGLRRHRAEVDRPRPGHDHPADRGPDHRQIDQPKFRRRSGWASPRHDDGHQQHAKTTFAAGDGRRAPGREITVDGPAGRKNYNTLLQPQETSQEFREPLKWRPAARSPPDAHYRWRAGRPPPMHDDRPAASRGAEQGPEERPGAGLWEAALMQPGQID